MRTKTQTQQTTVLVDGCSDDNISYLVGMRGPLQVCFRDQPIHGTFEVATWKCMH